MGIVKHSQSSQNSKFQMSLQYLKKEVKDVKLILSMQINIKVSYKLISTLSYKVILSLLMGMIKHSQSIQSNKFAISLQYLKKEVRNGVHFFACR